MRGDSFSTSASAVYSNFAPPRASAVVAGGCISYMSDASEASSRVETGGCLDLADCSSVSTPGTMVAGLTVAAAAMGMKSPAELCLGVFENSPISVLQGLGEDINTPPVPIRNSLDEGACDVARLDVFSNDASSHNSEVGVSRGAQSDVSDGHEFLRLPLLKIRSLRRPSLSLSGESGATSWNGGGRMAERRFKESSESVHSGEEVGDAELQGSVEIDAQKVEEDEEPESPTTPCSVRASPALECPDAPCGSRSAYCKELNRQSSLNDTKLLTTHYKRNLSNFLFDKHFEYLGLIGRGSYSDVYEVQERKKNGARYAVKISRKEFHGRNERDLYLREMQSVAYLPENPNVVTYFRSWQQSNRLYMQMELCENGSLRTLLDSFKEPLPEEQIWDYIRQVASGLGHIHSQGILHLDIKPENIFVDIAGVLKIGDFGLAVLGKLWEWEEGDGGYVAPELLRDEEPGPKADMFSFGVMVYEWATQTKLPRSGPLRDGQVILPGRSRALQELVQVLLNPNPSKRPSAMEVLDWRWDE